MRPTHARAVRCEALEARTLLTQFIVTSAADAGLGTLRQAILDANALPGADVVTFAIPGTGVHRIASDTGMPKVTGPLMIDAATQPGYAGRPLIELFRAAGVPSGDGVVVAAPDSTVRGLAIEGYQRQLVLAGSRDAVQGSYLGLLADGTNVAPPVASLVASTIGVEVTGANDTVGGALYTLTDPPTAGGAGANVLPSFVDRNVISGNDRYGVFLNGSDQAAVAGNFIGTDPAGLKPRPNGTGVGVSGGAKSTTTTAPAAPTFAPQTIGGTLLSARNVIAGNAFAGISVNADAASPVAIFGNAIGADLGGAPMGNGGDGVLSASTRGVTIGDPAVVGARNTIAYNAGAGIDVRAGAGVAARGNDVHDNAGVGIDLGGDGATANDPKDADDGPNGLQNYPVLDPAGWNLTSTVVRGTLNSTPNAVFVVDLYTDPTARAQGRAYLGSAKVTTDAAGNAAFKILVPAVANATAAGAIAVAPARRLTATATSVSLLASIVPTFGSTSEFSPPARVLIPGDANGDGRVDFQDLVRVAQNYNAATADGWAAADFNGDGTVDFNDLVLLAQGYNTDDAALPVAADDGGAYADAATAAAAAAPSIVTADAALAPALALAPAPSAVTVKQANHAVFNAAPPTRVSAPKPAARPLTRRHP